MINQIRTHGRGLLLVAVLLLFPSARSLAGRAGVDSLSPGSWTLTLAASMGGQIDSLSRFGVEPDATPDYDAPYDVPHPPNPPGDYVVSYFPHSGGSWPAFLGSRYASDISSPLSPRWLLDVESSLGSGTMVVAWDSAALNTLPAGYDVKMKDSSTSAVVSMRQQSSYSYAYTGQRMFVMWIEFGATIFTVSPKWNMVSVPLHASDSIKSTLFPSAVSPAFAYDGGYQTRPVLSGGIGYWLKFNATDVIAIQGSAMPAVPVTLKQGWNLIGSVDHDVPAPAGGIITSKCFGYQGAYVIDSIVQPGHGYWVKASSGGTIVLGGPAPPVQAHAAEQSASGTAAGRLELKFTDPTGRSARLYIAERRPGGSGSESFELPPVPPPGSFDVRFQSQRWLEEAAPGVDRMFPVDIQSPLFPVAVEVSGEHPRLRVAIAGSGQSGEDFVPLEPGRPVPVLESGRVRLRVEAASGRNVPAGFGLDQNVPNPFNPSTLVSYRLPERGKATVRIVDLLGRTVATLVDEVQAQGLHSVSWTPDGIQSGVYFCELAAGSHRDVKKILYVK